MNEPLPALNALSTRSLLRLYAGILSELVDREVVRSRNAPAGDLAETLVCAAYGGQLAPQAVKSWDVRTADEVKLQVKSRVIDRAKPKSGTFSPFRSWDFHACVFVFFDSESYAVTRAVELTADEVRQVATESKWVAGHRVSRAQLNNVGVDVTEKIAKAYEALDRVYP